MENDTKRLRPGPEWIPLPNFVFAVPLPAANDEILKGFVKVIISLTARGVQEVFSMARSEVQFVTLCHLTTENGEMTFSAYTPFLGLVEFARNHLPPRMKSEKLREVIAGMDVVIQHRYAVPVDQFTPLVVVYEPKSRHILLTNENHFTNPQQFLDPRICLTTSGFLSFLGTFTLQSARSSADRPQIIELSNAQDWRNKGLEQWFRWFSQITNDGRWEISRIFVNNQNPEQYIYSYDG